MTDYANRKPLLAHDPLYRRFSRWLTALVIAFGFLILQGLLADRDARIERIVERDRITVDLRAHCPPAGPGELPLLTLLIRSTADDAPVVENCVRYVERYTGRRSDR